MGSLTPKKPHVVCIPYPAQGHINPMLQLAKILHSKGFHITFVNTEFNHNRLVRTRGPDAVANRTSFRFETISDGMPPTDDIDSTQDIPTLCASTEKHSLGPFKRLLVRLNEAGDVPPVTCVVSDGAMYFTLDAAEELGVPEVLLWTASACGLLGYAQYQRLVELELAPFKDANFLTNGDLETILDWVPGMKEIRLRDIPSFIRTTNPDEFMVGYIQRLVHNSKRASGIIFNTFDALEGDVLQSFPSDFPPLYALGPFQLLLESTKDVNNDTKSLSTSLWKEDPQCLDWLDTYEPNSVVYVNFGSITVMSNDQLAEFAWGLGNSNQPFLWIMRPDLVTGEKAILPLEFLEMTKDRGLITSWCNQEKVLKHPAIGGFLTHCGWNSTVETLINGVPIVCWPFFAEQQTNCWYSCGKWGIGMEIDSNVKRSEVERQVRELMKGDKGREMKKNAMEWKKLAQEAVNDDPKGSSYTNLEKVIEMLLGSQNNKFVKTLK